MRGRGEGLGDGGEGKEVVKCYRDLIVWQRAMDLVAASYKLATVFPKAELYTLSAQLKRAAISIPANIAEGHGRMHLGDYMHHLSFARGSIMELETHVLLGQHLGFIGSSQSKRVLDASEEVSRMLAVLIKRLKHRAGIRT